MNLIPSNLKSKTILMVGRANNKYKRFKLGVHAMEYIIKQNPICNMRLISNINGTYELQNLIHNLNLENYIEFIGYTLIPEIYFKNSSLHIFPSITESFGLVLSETKIYGIPNILVGLDYVQISKGGTIIIYDDSPESIAKESLKIINNINYRKKLGKQARNSMKEFNNKILFYKWVKLILSIYNGDEFYKKLKRKEKNINESELVKSFNHQIKLLKKRDNNFKNISIKDFKNFSKLYEYKNN
jgi:glycosyltransferase involved in cell wall biosynthesis